MISQTHSAVVLDNSVIINPRNKYTALFNISNTVVQEDNVNTEGCIMIQVASDSGESVSDGMRGINCDE